MPDLNSVPPSPHVLALRSASSQMPPPPVPSSPSLNILPSNQNAVNNATPASASAPSQPSPSLLPTGTISGPTLNDNTGVGPGPGPLRHPRPMTTVEMHLQLEKEQEAVVNRLTRELTILRAAHNSSVVSNASSTSASATESTHVADAPLLAAGAGFSHPHQGRRQRTSSNASTRSVTANPSSVSAASLAGISAPAPVRPGQQQPLGGISLSRQNSAASRRSRAESPVPQPPLSSSQHSSQAQTPSHSFTQSHLSEYFASRAPQAGLHIGTGGGGSLSTTTSMQVATPGSAISEQLSPGLLPGTSRYEETAFYRAELDSVKRENEALKRRVRELERSLRMRRSSDASQAGQSQSQSQGQGQSHGHAQGHSQGGGGAMRPRSESVSTTASVSAAASTTPGGVSIAIQRERERLRVASTISSVSSVGVGVPEEELLVGESAASAGLGPGSAGLGHRGDSSSSQDNGH